MIMMNILCVLMFLFLVFLTEDVVGQKAGCEEREPNKLEYKLVKSARYIVGGQPVLKLDVAIVPKMLNREDMIRLACKINLDLRKEERVYVTFFTNARAARTFNESFHPHSKRYQRNLEALRGHYFLDRVSGEEYVRFAAIGKRSFDEERIDLKK
jgi:hypothetical protein